jgi:hypothetical protein
MERSDSYDHVNQHEIDEEDTPLHRTSPDVLGLDEEDTPPKRISIGPSPVTCVFDTPKFTVECITQRSEYANPFRFETFAYKPDSYFRLQVNITASYQLQRDPVGSSLPVSFTHTCADLELDIQRILDAYSTDPMVVTLLFSMHDILTRDFRKRLIKRANPLPGVLDVKVEVKATVPQNTQFEYRPRMYTWTETLKTCCLVLPHFILDIRPKYKGDPSEIQDEIYKEFDEQLKLHGF